MIIFIKNLLVILLPLDSTLKTRLAILWMLSSLTDLVNESWASTSIHKYKSSSVHLVKISKDLLRVSIEIVAYAPISRRISDGLIMLPMSSIFGNVVSLWTSSKLSSSPGRTSGLISLFFGSFAHIFNA